MQFQILSHAGLLVQGSGKTLLFDPWLVGSTYWRSWWNYPPVERDLVESLHPDFIYLTHIHWDHFQGTSLRRFPRETPIIIPMDTNPRLRGDLVKMGFARIHELPHGGTFDLAPGFRLTSWQFYPFTDSAAVVECEGTVLFNANDAKFMGAPLGQILRRHGEFDFVFRSHSSANPRTCFDFMDKPEFRKEDPEGYLRAFAAFARATGARYAIPFASNHCYLHKEVFHLNDGVITPAQVEAYCETHGLRGTEVKVMVSGDSWSREAGFSKSRADFFTNRSLLLQEYALNKSVPLEKFYALEAATDVSLSQVSAYFRRFAEALPWAARQLFRNRRLAFRVTGARTRHFEINLHRGEAREVGGLDDIRHPLQVHTSTYIFRQCMARDLFLYLGISKRVLYRCRQSDRKYLLLVEHFFNMYECGQLPLRRLFTWRFLHAWLPRWRELLLYARIAMGKAAGKGFRMEEFLPPRPTSRRISGRMRKPELQETA